MWELETWDWFGLDVIAVDSYKSLVRMWWASLGTSWVSSGATWFSMLLIMVFIMVVIYGNQQMHYSNDLELRQVSRVVTLSR